MKIEKNEVILKHGVRPKEVMFIMSGNVLNSDTGRLFSEGSMFGETDLIFDLPTRLDSYIADTDCYILKFDKHVFEKIRMEFPEINEEVTQLAISRK